MKDLLRKQENEINEQKKKQKKSKNDNSTKTTSKTAKKNKQDRLKKQENEIIEQKKKPSAKNEKKVSFAKWNVRNPSKERCIVFSDKSKEKRIKESLEDIVHVGDVYKPKYIDEKNIYEWDLVQKMVEPEDLDSFVDQDEKGNDFKKYKEHYDKLKKNADQLYEDHLKIFNDSDKTEDDEKYFIYYLQEDLIELFKYSGLRLLRSDLEEIARDVLVPLQYGDDDVETWVGDILDFSIEESKINNQKEFLEKLIKDQEKFIKNLESGNIPEPEEGERDLRKLDEKKLKNLIKLEKDGVEQLKQRKKIYDQKEELQKSIEKKKK